MTRKRNKTIYPGLHCGHCGDPRGKGKRTKPLIKTKNWKPDKLKEAVEIWLASYFRDKHYYGFRAEQIAYDLRAEIDKVRQQLHILNLEGKVSQATLQPPHDCRRDKKGQGNDNSWCGKLYYYIKE